MNRFIAIGFVIISGGCSGVSSPDSNGLNPFEHCRRLGYKEITEEYNQCISQYIEQQCTKEGQTPGSDGYRKCEKNLRNAAFVRDQMQIRGF